MKEIISDKVYESSMLSRLEQTKELLQSVVDAFHSLDLQTCSSTSDLYDLVFNPQSMYDQGKYLKEADIEGLTDHQAEQYRAKLKFKDPHNYIKIAKAAQQDSYTEKGQNLFLLKDGKVELNMKEADPILKQRTLYAYNERQEALGANMVKLTSMLSDLTKASHGTLELSKLLKFAERDPAGAVSLNLVEARRILNLV